MNKMNFIYYTLILVFISGCFNNNRCNNNCMKVCTETHEFYKDMLKGIYRKQGINPNKVDEIITNAHVSFLCEIPCERSEK